MTQLPPNRQWEKAMSTSLDKAALQLTKRLKQHIEHEYHNEFSRKQVWRQIKYEFRILDQFHEIEISNNIWNELTDLIVLSDFTGK